MGRRMRRLLMIVWPEQCAICDCALHRRENAVCLSCLAKMPNETQPRQLTFIGAPGDTIPLVSWFLYNPNNPSHLLIHHIKYHDRINLARKLGREFAALKTAELGKIEIILPIPLHWTKFVQRSYNQTREIARGINDVTGIRVAANLYARSPHKSQTHINSVERTLNVHNIFGVRHPEELNGRHIALLDDVVTTGATMYSALESILSVSMPASVTFLSLARTHRS